ncbi:MAG: hypothetical protein FWE63_01915 [Bacteroidales bacterium]|nr:hypothetical protein [Bacteroidales bacterium]
MKLKITKKGVNFTDLTIDQANAIITVVTTADKRCFGELEKQKNGDYYSGEHFVCVLSSKQRKALSVFCKSFTKQLNKIQPK